MQLIQQLSPYIAAAYGIASILANVLPKQWAVTKLMQRLALDLRGSEAKP